MATVNLEKELTMLDGTPLKDTLQEVLTVKKVLINSLLSKEATPQGADRNKFDKYKCYQLAQRIENSKEINFTAEETVELKTLVDRIYSVIVVGQVYDILEPQA